MPSFVRSTLVFVTVAAAALAAACSSSSNDGTTPGGSGESVTAVGTVSGQSLAAAGGFVIAGPSGASATIGPGLPDGGVQTTTGWELAIAVVDNAAVGTCSFVDTLGSSDVANVSVLSLIVATATGSSVPVGTYDVGESGSFEASANYATTSSTCVAGASVDATVGTITFTAVSGTSVTGSYDVTFGASGSLHGTFDVPVCAPPSVENDGVKSCKQP